MKKKFCSVLTIFSSHLPTCRILQIGFIDPENLKTRKDRCTMHIYRYLDVYIHVYRYLRKSSYCGIVEHRSRKFRGKGCCIFFCEKKPTKKKCPSIKVCQVSKGRYDGNHKKYIWLRLFRANVQRGMKRWRRGGGFCVKNIIGSETSSSDLLSAVMSSFISDVSTPSRHTQKYLDVGIHV